MKFNIPKGHIAVAVLVLLKGENEYAEALYCQDGQFRWGYGEPAIADVEDSLPMPTRQLRGDERGRFEAWSLSLFPSTDKYEGSYEDDRQEWAFKGWQARADLETAPVVERQPVAPHVVGYMPDSPDGDPLITLAYHQAYVDEMRAKIEALCNHPSMSFHQVALLEGVLPSDDEVCKAAASPPAPVADDLVRLLTRARIYARSEFREEIDACLKELNQ
ncbi:hypothetical protein D9M71_545290 [compost metagenome]